MRLLLLTGLLSALSGEALAQALLYGRLNAGIEQLRVDAGARRSNLSRLSAYRSVLGVRGQEDLGLGLQVVWQIEGGVSLDNGAGAVANRDTRIGLQGRWGLLYLGHWLTPYQQSTSGLDPLYATTVGLASFIGNGSVPTTDNTSNLSSFDRRQANTIGWQVSPSAGWVLRLALTPPEERDRRPGFSPTLQSGSLEREGDWGRVVLAYERHHDYQAPGRDDEGIKLGMSTEVNRVRLSLVAERLHYRVASGSLKRTAWFTSASMPIGASGDRFIVNYAQAGSATGQEGLRIGFMQGGGDSGARQLTLAYEHVFSKRTVAYLFTARLRNDARGVVDFNINPVGMQAGGQADIAGLGIRTSF